MVYLLERQGTEVGEESTDFVQTDPHNTGEAPRCEVCGAFVGMLHWEAPLRVELETWGSAFGDLAFGPGDSFLVSERFKNLWGGQGLSGLSGFEPVEVVKVRQRGKRLRAGPPPYYRVEAARSRVAIDPNKSGIRWETPPRCDACLSGIVKGWERVVLRGEPDQDLFIARGHPGQVLTSERFKRFCDEQAITNCRMIPGEQASHWF